jgi:hypothetical protein
VRVLRPQLQRFGISEAHAHLLASLRDEAQAIQLAGVTACLPGAVVVAKNNAAARDYFDFSVQFAGHDEGIDTSEAGFAQKLSGEPDDKRIRSSHPVQDMRTQIQRESGAATHAGVRLTKAAKG